MKPVIDEHAEELRNIRSLLEGNDDLNKQSLLCQKIRGLELLEDWLRFHDLQQQQMLELLPMLRELTGHYSTQVRLKVLKATKKMLADDIASSFLAKNVLPWLVRRLGDLKLSVRLEACRCLLYILASMPCQRLFPALEEEWSSRSWRSKEALLRCIAWSLSMGTMQHKSLAPYKGGLVVHVVDALRDAKSVVRSAAMDCLVELHSREPTLVLPYFLQPNLRPIHKHSLLLKLVGDLLASVGQCGCSEQGVHLLSLSSRLLRLPGPSPADVGMRESKSLALAQLQVSQAGGTAPPPPRAVATVKGRWGEPGGKNNDAFRLRRSSLEGSVKMKGTNSRPWEGAAGEGDLLGTAPSGFARKKVLATGDSAYEIHGDCTIPVGKPEGDNLNPGKVEETTEVVGEGANVALAVEEVGEMAGERAGDSAEPVVEETLNDASAAPGKDKKKKSRFSSLKSLFKKKVSPVEPEALKKSMSSSAGIDARTSQDASSVNTPDARPAATPTTASATPPAAHRIVPLSLTSRQIHTMPILSDTSHTSDSTIQNSTPPLPRPIANVNGHSPFLFNNIPGCPPGAPILPPAVPPSTPLSAPLSPRAPANTSALYTIGITLNEPAQVGRRSLILDAVNAQLADFPTSFSSRALYSQPVPNPKKPQASPPKPLSQSSSPADCPSLLQPAPAAQPSTTSQPSSWSRSTKTCTSTTSKLHTSSKLQGSPSQEAHSRSRRASASPSGSHSRSGQTSHSPQRVTSPQPRPSNTTTRTSLDRNSNPLSKSTGSLPHRLAASIEHTPSAPSLELEPRLSSRRSMPTSPLSTTSSRSSQTLGSPSSSKASSKVVRKQWDRPNSPSGSVGTAHSGKRVTMPTLKADAGFARTTKSWMSRTTKTATPLTPAQVLQCLKEADAHSFSLTPTLQKRILPPGRGVSAPLSFRSRAQAKVVCYWRRSWHYSSGYSIGTLPRFDKPSSWKTLEPLVRAAVQPMLAEAKQPIREQLNQLHDQLHNMSNWEKRVEALEQLEQMLDVGCPTDRHFIPALVSMGDVLAIQISDRRTMLSRQAVQVLLQLTYELGTAIEHLAVAVLPALLKELRSLHKVRVEGASSCIDVIIQKIQSPHLIQGVAQNMIDSRHPQVRQHCCRYLTEMLRTWKSQHYRIVLPTIEEAILTAAMDHKPSVFHQAQSLYQGFRQAQPRLADRMLVSMSREITDRLLGNVTEVAKKSRLSMREVIELWREEARQRKMVGEEVEWKVVYVEPKNVPLDERLLPARWGPAGGKVEGGCSEAVVRVGSRAWNGAAG